MIQLTRIRLQYSFYGLKKKASDKRTKIETGTMLYLVRRTDYLLITLP